jgi:hypothetical protein
MQPKEKQVQFHISSSSTSKRPFTHPPSYVYLEFQALLRVQAAISRLEYTKEKDESGFHLEYLVGGNSISVLRGKLLVSPLTGQLSGYRVINQALTQIRCALLFSEVAI